MMATDHDDGWFRTGDASEMQASIDDRDTFTFTARIGDVLRIGGFLVAPVEIEQVIHEIDGIAETQEVAVDRPSGARPVVFITGQSPPPEVEVIEHCRNRLALFKCPATRAWPAPAEAGSDGDPGLFVAPRVDVAGLGDPAAVEAWRSAGADELVVMTNSADLGEIRAGLAHVATLAAQV